MRQVAGPDAAFLYGERPEWHFHVSAVMIVDPSTTEDFSADRVRRQLQSRIHKMPQFRWKLLNAPLGIDRPVFVDDPRFDIDAHVRHIAVPPPGDRESLGRLVGQLVSYKLDRTRPLWEMWIIEGVEGGKVAFLTKVHHSIVDGVSGSDLATILLDLEPDPGPDPEPPPYVPEPAPGVHELAYMTAKGFFSWPFRALRLTEQVARQSVTMLQHSLRDAPPVQPFQAPRTPFNGTLTPHREFAWARVSLDDAKRVKNAFGVKLNDVVLAIAAGALRSYLADHHELPDRPLVAQVPVSVRTDATRDDVGTQVAAMFASLATDEPDAGERLRLIAEGTRTAKQMRKALSANRIMGLTDTTPPGLIALAARMFTASGLEGRTPPIFNLIISNVPGPPFDLYLAGARVEAMYPMGPLLYGSGVNITCISNPEAIDFGFMACPELMPDPWDLADRTASALADLVEAAKAYEAEGGRLPRRSRRGTAKVASISSGRGTGTRASAKKASPTRKTTRRTARGDGA